MSINRGTKEGPSLTKVASIASWIENKEKIKASACFKEVLNLKESVWRRTQYSQMLDDTRQYISRFFIYLRLLFMEVTGISIDMLRLFKGHFDATTNLFMFLSA